MTDSQHTVTSLDALMPPEMARKAEQVGEKKANLDLATMFVLALLGGAFIAWGAALATVVATTGSAEPLPFGVTKVLGGLVFCVGLILVVVAGAELFTGNNLIVMGWASGRVTSGNLLRNWIVVYIGNLIGALATAAIVYFAGAANQANGAVGETMMKIAAAKCNLGFAQAMSAGIGCNALVCVAIWLCMSARSVTDKIAAIVFPITTFVATGMEHCVANMYFIPIGMLARGSADVYPELSLNGFLVGNLLPVTIGNIIGGAGLVGLVYWFAYLRKSSA